MVVLEDDMKINQDFKDKLDGVIEYLDQHKELDWYLINIATKEKKLAKDITNVEGMSLWHAFYFPIRGLGLVWSRQGARSIYASWEKNDHACRYFLSNMAQ